MEADLPEHIRALAAINGVFRIIDDRFNVETDEMIEGRIALVRRPRGHGRPVDAPECIAYVHAQCKLEWLPDDAAWFELFSQLWPGY